MEKKSYTRVRLGEMLIANGVITEDQLKATLKVQKEKKERIGTIFKKLGYATEDDIILVLGKQMGIKHLSLSNIIVDRSLLQKVPESIARKYQVIPVYKKNDVLTLSMVDPLDVFAIDKIKELTGLEVEPVVSKESEVMRAISANYLGGKSKLQDAASSVDDATDALDQENLQDTEADSPVIKLVNNIISEAVTDGASDVHIEPEADKMRVRYRVDGIMREVMSSPKTFYSSLISRIKVMGGLDISEKRVPQDGRCQLNVSGHEIDIRISTLPTIFGEKIVLRLLDRQNIFVELEHLGLEGAALEALKRQIKKPYGLMLVTGPTGSGKTSTLYAILNSINTLEKNIVTVEDPVEYQMSIINQVQVNPKVGVGFAHGLRAIMRQDPDVIMVGEIRDSETAVMAIQAALTGHMVFSTLHSNDAASAVTRLLNMGIEPFLVASSLTSVVAQRLVRKICPACKEEVPASEEISVPEVDLQGAILFRGKGCDKCRNSGYSGRTGIFEYLEVDDPIRQLIYKKADAAQIHDVARENGMLTLREAAARKAISGISSLEETMRVTIDA